MREMRENPMVNVAVGGDGVGRRNETQKKMWMTKMRMSQISEVF